MVAMCYTTRLKLCTIVRRHPWSQCVAYYTVRLSLSQTIRPLGSYGSSGLGWLRWTGLKTFPRLTCLPRSVRATTLPAAKCQGILQNIFLLLSRTFSYLLLLGIRSFHQDIQLHQVMLEHKEKTSLISENLLFLCHNNGQSIVTIIDYYLLAPFATK